jgi:hypothetical protein
MKKSIGIPTITKAPMPARSPAGVGASIFSLAVFNATLDLE